MKPLPWLLACLVVFGGVLPGCSREPVHYPVRVESVTYPEGGEPLRGEIVSECRLVEPFKAYDVSGVDAVLEIRFDGNAWAQLPVAVDGDRWKVHPQVELGRGRRLRFEGFGTIGDAGAEGWWKVYTGEGRSLHQEGKFSPAAGT